MTPTRADADRWAALVARAYAEACRPPLSAAEEAQLARALDGPATARIFLGEVPPAEEVDPALALWEFRVKRGPGPRFGRVDHGRGTVEMRG